MVYSRTFLLEIDEIKALFSGIIKILKHLRWKWLKASLDKCECGISPLWLIVFPGRAPLKSALILQKRKNSFCSPAKCLSLLPFLYFCSISLGSEGNRPFSWFLFILQYVEAFVLLSLSQILCWGQFPIICRKPRRTWKSSMKCDILVTK